MRDDNKDEIWQTLFAVAAIIFALVLAVFAFQRTTEPTGETIIYRTDRLPLPCEEVSE